VNIDELREHLCATYPLLCPLFSTEYGDGVLTVDFDIVHDAAADLKALGFDRLGMVTAVDRGEFFEMVYRLTSREIRAGLFLKCALPRRDPKVATMFDLWPAADWQEREVYDMFGIEFVGHPDLRRILMPEDWVGYPLRKDYNDDRIVKRPDYI
jgi:NADH:ubiquinone oxidoreductase subunit C